MGSSGENVNWEPHNRMCRLVLLLGLFGLCSSVHILPSPSYIHTSPLVNSLAGNYVVAPVSYQSQFYYPQQINALNSFYQPPKPLVSPSLGYPIYNYGSPLVSTQNSVSAGNVQTTPLLKLKTVGHTPIPYIDPRALCSFCSCENDFGCSYNCDKCDALCLTCDCSTSIGCEYNCDKCEKAGQSETSSDKLTFGISSDLPGTPGSVSSSPGSASSSAGSQSSSAGSQSSSGGSQSAPQVPSGYEPLWDTPAPQGDKCAPLLSSEIELCMWGPSCKHMVSSLFPSCNYSCETCQLNPSSSCVATSGEAAGQPCIFPFIYKGIKYDGCAPIHSLDRGLDFWCSTKTDVNGYHIRGPYNDVGRYVGYCDSTCPKALPQFF